ncbi:hypothetical protein ACOSP7_007337 [Xanthoceras sorbifolium]
MNGDKQILREHDLTISGKSKILGSDPLSCPQYEDSHAVIVQNSTDLLHGPGVSHAEILMVVDGPEYGLLAQVTTSGPGVSTKKKN